MQSLNQDVKFFRFCCYFSILFLLYFAGKNGYRHVVETPLDTAETQGAPSETIRYTFTTNTVDTGSFDMVISPTGIISWEVNYP